MTAVPERGRDDAVGDVEVLPPVAELTLVPAPVPASVVLVPASRLLVCGFELVPAVLEGESVVPLPLVEVLDCRLFCDVIPVDRPTQSGVLTVKLGLAMSVILGSRVLVSIAGGFVVNPLELAEPECSG
jgi:hypothetical protein